MASDGKSTHIDWICPKNRGQLSILNMHIPKKLSKSVRNMKLGGKPYEIKVNTAFEQVIHHCAEQTSKRQETWINKEIIDVFTLLHRMGYAHSLECWQNETLCAGLYGLAIGGAFFGESMFSRQRDASKAALVHLVARLHYAGFEILDTQFVNVHLQQFGVYEITHSEYIKALKPALQKECKFDFTPIDEESLIRNYFAMRSGEKFGNTE